MCTPHKHAALIKAWADGATIQCLVPRDYHEDCCGKKSRWIDLTTPSWELNQTYRIKPPPKKKGWYRVALLINGNTRTVNHTFPEELSTEKRDDFVRWLADSVEFEYD